jgi:hypothetical protein
MEPVNNTSNNSSKTTCNYQSSNCVIWEGPDLPCINLCKGDSIQDVVYRMATKLCEMSEAIKIDVSTIDFDCITEDNGTPPDSLKETIQALVYKACQQVENQTTTTLPLPNIVLPTCLRYNDANGDPVTILPIDEFVSVFAGEFCGIVQDVQSLELSFVNLESRITDLEAVVAGLGTPSGGTGTVPTINPLCVSGPIGTPTPIDEAFEALESDYCSYKYKVGTEFDINMMLTKQCPSLGGEDQLSNTGVAMSDIVGWKSTPQSISDSLTNAWLTICDMRSKFKEYLDEAAAKCVAIPPFTLNISSITTNAAVITWTSHSLVDFEKPGAYTISVFEYNPVTQQTVGVAIAGLGGIFGELTFSTSINTSSLDYNKQYAVQIVASYDTCGDSQPVQVVGQLRSCPTNYKLKVQSDTETSVAVPSGCGLGSPVTDKTRRLLVTLTDSGGVTVVNGKSTNITATVRLKVTDCNLANDVWEYYNISIAPNASTWSMTYDSQKHHLCVSGGTCTPIIRGNAALSITIDTISDCDVIAGTISYL